MRQVKFRDMLNIEALPIKVDHAKCWTGIVKGSVDIKVVELWPSRSDDNHLREFKTE
jgi:predicted DNA binding protein